MKVHYTPTTQPLHDTLLPSNESTGSSCSPLNHRAVVEARQTQTQTQPLDENDRIVTARSLREAKDRFHSCVARGLSLLVTRCGYGRRRAIRLILDQIRQSDPIPGQDQIFRGMQVIGMGMDAITHTIIVSNALEKIKAERGLSDIEAIEHLSSRLRTGALLNAVKQQEDRDRHDDEAMEESGSEKDIIMANSVVIEDAAMQNDRSSVTSTSSSVSGSSSSTTHLMKPTSPYAHCAPNSVPVSVSSPSLSCNNTSTTYTTCEESPSIIHTKNSTNTTTNMNTTNSHNNSTGKNTGTANNNTSTSSSTPKSNKIRKHNGSSKSKSSRVILKTPKTQRQKRKSSTSSNAIDMAMSEESETNVNAKFKVVAEKQKALSSSPSSSNGHGHGHCASSSSGVGSSPTSSANGATSSHGLVVGNKRKSVGGTDGDSSDTETKTHSHPPAPKRQRLDSI